MRHDGVFLVRLMFFSHGMVDQSAVEGIFLITIQTHLINSALLSATFAPPRFDFCPCNDLRPRRCRATFPSKLPHPSKIENSKSKIISIAGSLSGGGGGVVLAVVAWGENAGAAGSAQWHDEPVAAG